MNETVDIITMGCSKNLVDSEQLIYKLNRMGYDVYHNPEQIHKGIVIVNTCGFIESAKQESIDMILDLCQAKTQGQIKRLYVMGCLSQRYKPQLCTEIPQVDEYFGKFDWKNIISRLEEYADTGKNVRYDITLDCLHSRNVNNHKAKSYSDCLTISESGRAVTTPRHYAYIKISEGCDRLCSYCAIPLITGRQISRTMDSIEAEVRALVAIGTKEFQIIAQDSTSYGTDIYHRMALPELLERLSDIKGVEWLRLHYAYPDNFPDDVLRVMRERDNVCKYLDIALQHIDNNVLATMHRHITSSETYDLIAHIREEVPQISLRTTLMVGFPSEDDTAFEKLERFVSDVRFEHMGAFAYSEEEGTYAASHYTDSVSKEVKQQRLDRLMAVQQRISADLCSQKVGKTLRTVIDRKEGDYYVGRTQFDSPEVDGEVLIDINKQKQIGNPLSVGTFYNVRITDSSEFDLFGVMNN